jgi:NO-binding membrane sensor protein with MHYT domain
LTEVHHFAHGWLNPALAYLMAVLGCLVGLLHATKARTRPGRRRVRMLLYASVAIGMTGVWQMHFIAMLGFEVPGLTLRYDRGLLVASLVLALLVVSAGLFTAGYGTLRGWRLVAAGVLIGVGIAAMHYTGMAAIRLGGAIDYEPMRFVASVLVAIIAATASLWFVTVLRGLAATVLAAMVMGGAISGMHYTAMSAVRVHVGVPHPPVTGVDPMLLVAPIVLLGGAAIAMLAFFTFGASTVRDLRLIYEASGELSEPIEPWMIEEVLARTSRPPAALPAGPGAESGPAPVSHRARRPRIDRALRNTVVWNGTPVWGSPADRAGASAPAPTAPPRTSPPRASAAAAVSGAWAATLSASATRSRGSAPVVRPPDQSPRATLAVTPARYPPNDPGWACPGVAGARAPEYRGNRRP